MQEELLSVVDEHDRVVGYRERGEVHRLGLRHRAVHVMVFNRRGEVFLQKRSLNKDEFPGLWDSSAAGHLAPGEGYAECALRELEEELETLLARVDADDLEQQMERLRQFAQGNRLRVAAADLTEAIPLMVVSDYLTYIAETVIDRVVRLAWQEVSRRHGRPPGLEAGETGLAVVGYGKLGGIELGYGSDLDMVCLDGIEV